MAQVAAVTHGSDCGDRSGWTAGDVTMVAAASVYNTEDDSVDYVYTASGSVLRDPEGVTGPDLEYIFVGTFGTKLTL